MDTNKIMLAWSAGLLDADGTLTIKRTKRFNKWYYIPIVQVAQINTEKGKNNIYRLKDIHGGNVRESVVKKGGTNLVDKRIITWQVTSNAAMRCVNSVSDLMTGKKRQALLLKEFFMECYVKKVSYRLTEEDSLKRKHFFERIRELQEKGFTPSNND